MEAGPYSSIKALTASNRSGRKVSSLLEPCHLAEARRLLDAASQVAVVTGFYVPACAAPETDGPAGAVMIARALERSGREATLFTDPLCFDALRSASLSAGGPAVKQAGSGREILDGGPDLVIFLERLGRAEDGKYYNMRGEDVSSTTPPLDEAAFLARGKEISVVAVGDGGNEVGMGNFRSSLSKLLPEYASCLSVTEADVTLPVDVSDWGGFALAALLSFSCGRWLGPEEDEIEGLLRALAEKGAVDGVTRRHALSVDGFPLEEHRRIVRSLKEAVISSVLQS